MMATIFALGKAAQAEACLKGTRRLRQRRPSRKAPPPKGRDLFCRSAVLRAKGNTFQVLPFARALRKRQNRSRHCKVYFLTAPYAGLDGAGVRHSIAVVCRWRICADRLALTYFASMELPLEDLECQRRAIAAPGFSMNSQAIADDESHQNFAAAGYHARVMAGFDTVLTMPATERVRAGPVDGRQESASSPASCPGPSFGSIGESFAPGLCPVVSGWTERRTFSSVSSLVETAHRRDKFIF